MSSTYLPFVGNNPAPIRATFKGLEGDGMIAESAAHSHGAACMLCQRGTFSVDVETPEGIIRGFFFPHKFIEILA